jgi:hypothetical protein
MTNETKLPDGLELAVAHIEELRSIYAVQFANASGTVHHLRIKRTAHLVATCDVAIDAIRAEHTQRLTLQHHAADQAQRIVELEAERDVLREQKQLLIEAQLDEISENLRLRDLAVANADENITAVIERVIRERDELRTRLAERQEPVAISKDGNLFWAGNPQDNRGVNCSLYAHPVPAIPAGWKLVPVEPTQKMLGEGACASCLPGPHYIGEQAAAASYRNMLTAAPEAAR